MSTKKPARANSFNGEATPIKKTTERIAIVAYLLANPSTHSYAKLMEATGYSRSILKSRLSSAAATGEVVNVNGPGHPAQWQHRTHHKVERPAEVVRRINPIANASMPNGSRAWWAKQMAAFNASPRVA